MSKLFQKYSEFVAVSSIAGEDVVGSLGVANDHGVLLHPDVLPDEVLLIEEVLGVSPMVGTVHGSPYVGAGLLPQTTVQSLAEKQQDLN